MEELEELFLKSPEAEEPVFGNFERAEADHRFEKGEIGVEITRALESGKFETVLDAGHHNRGPVQRFGHFDEGVGG